MLKGIHLTLMIGPAVPVPVSKEILDALISVEVTNTTDGPSLFQLRFTLTNDSILQTIFLVAGGVDIPLVRVLILITIGGTPDVLIDGVMTHHEIMPGADAAHSTLAITGEDLTRVMNYIDFTGFPFPAMPAEARVALICAKYAFLGVIPIVVPSVTIDLPIPTNRIPKQQGTDLRYLQKLANDVGYTFYVEAGPAPGTSIAYWGPEIRVGVPQAALNINMDSFTNVESLNFQFRNDQKTVPLVTIQEPFSKAPIPIPIPDISPFSPPLGLVPGTPKNFLPIKATAKLSFAQAFMIGLAKAAKSADSVTGTGTLNVLRYGQLLKARRLVGVRGAGKAFDGLYYVKSVTHNLKRGEYKQSFTLARNGLISTLGKVPA